MPDARHQGLPAVLLDHVFRDLPRPYIVRDSSSGLFAKKNTRHDAAKNRRIDALAFVIDEKNTITVSVGRNAQIRFFGNDALLERLLVLLFQRIGLVIRRRHLDF